MLKTTNVNSSIYETIYDYINETIGGIQKTYSEPHTSTPLIVPEIETYETLYKLFKDAVKSNKSGANSSSSDDSYSSDEKDVRKETTSGSNTSSSYSPEYETRDVWIDCMECHGSGKCKYCQGTGKDWYGNSYETCVVCHGSTNCQICYGTGGHYEKQMFQVR